MINIRKRNNLYEYRFEAGKINGKEQKNLHVLTLKKLKDLNILILQYD